MSRTFSAALCFSMLVIVACSSKSPHSIAADWKMGQRRGQGVEPEHLHASFTLAHAARSMPTAHQSSTTDPALKLAEDLWFAGDRDFANALAKEPFDVRRAVAHYLMSSGMMHDFPRTRALLSAAEGQ